jgi:hypothetical protein
MGEIKPIGSEKLKGDEKLKRILHLTYYNQKPITENNDSKKAELIKETVNGVYGIVRERDHYYVKKGLNESSLDYIGGLFMKNKNKFNSYAEALKRLELLSSRELNEDATKYVLKTNKPTQETPISEPQMDLPPADMDSSGSGLSEPTPDFGADDELPMPEEPSTPEMDSSPEESKRSDYMAEVQKFAGKLGQELRDQQVKMESDDIKYVLNMVISAVDLDKLDDEDIEDIGKKFERDDESMGDVNEPELEPEEEDEEPVAPEDDLAERISKLEELINTKFKDDNQVELGEDEFDDYFPDIDSDYEEKTHLDYDPTDDYEMDNRPSRMYDDEDEDDLDITPELDEINESINNTLSKYFE